MYTYCPTQKCQPLTRVKPGPTGPTGTSLPGPTGPPGASLIFAGNVAGLTPSTGTIENVIPISTIYGLHQIQLL